MPRPKKYTPEQAADMARRYHAGETVAMLAGAYSLERHTISAALRDAGVPPLGRALRQEQGREIAHRYMAGESSKALATAYGVSQPTILSELRRQGIEIRRGGVPTAEDEAEMVAMWDDGASVHQIIQHFQVHGNTVRRRLHKHGRALETRYDKPRKFTPEQEQGITRLYMDGMLPREIQEQFGCARLTVTDIVRRNGGIVRSRGGTWRKWTDEQVAEMNRRWRAGESQESIAKSFGTTQAKVSRLLIDFGYNESRRSRIDSKHPLYKPERILNNRGYVMLLLPDGHPLASMRNRNGYVLEHRLVMAEKLGRPLLHDEHVHHIDGNRQHNKAANLQLVKVNHGAGVRYRCRCCGSTDVEAIEFDVG